MYNISLFIYNNFHHANTDFSISTSFQVKKSIFFAILRQFIEISHTKNHSAHKL